MQSEELRDLFRTNLRSRRRELNLTQAQLATSIGAAHSYVSDLERGRISPNITSLAAIAEALDTTPSAMLSSVAVPIS